MTTVAAGCAETVDTLRTLLDIVTDGVLATDVNGVRIYSNPALDDYVGCDACRPRQSSGPPAFLPPEAGARYLAYFEPLQNGGTTPDLKSTDWRVTSADGEITPTPVHILPVRIGSADLVGLLWVFHRADRIDSDRAKRLESAVQEIGKTLDEVGLEPATSRTGRPAPMPDLSRREKEVLALLLDGHRVATIADSLCLSSHTVRNHLKSIFRKTDVHSQAELVQLARGNGDHSGNGGNKTRRS